METFELIGYSYANFAGCRIDRKSKSRTCQFQGGRLVSLFSKKKIYVATSTDEAEYIVAGSEINLEDAIEDPKGLGHPKR